MPRTSSTSSTAGPCSSSKDSAGVSACHVMVSSSGRGSTGSLPAASAMSSSDTPEAVVVATATNLGREPGGSSACQLNPGDPESTQWAAMREGRLHAPTGDSLAWLGHVGKPRDAPETPGRPVSPRPGKTEEARVGGAGDNRAALNPPTPAQGPMGHGSSRTSTSRSFSNFVLGSDSAGDAKRSTRTWLLEAHRVKPHGAHRTVRTARCPPNSHLVHVLILVL